MLPTTNAMKFMDMRLRFQQAGKYLKFEFLNMVFLGIINAAQSLCNLLIPIQFRNMQLSAIFLFIVKTIVCFGQYFWWLAICSSACLTIKAKVAQDGSPASSKSALQEDVQRQLRTIGTQTCNWLPKTEYAGRRRDVSAYVSPFVSYYQDGCQNPDPIHWIPPTKVSPYVSNMRSWISTNILRRLVDEIDCMNGVLLQNGLGHLQIGNVEVQDLHTLSKNPQFVQHYAPLLPAMVPYLEAFTDQYYLVKRIKELAQGTEIEKYSWHPAQQQSGKDLPSDGAIIFHFICVFLDSQLIPRYPSDTRPFHSRYVVTWDKKRPLMNIINRLNNGEQGAILVTDGELNPKFSFISGKQRHDCPRNESNIFYVLIQLLLYLRTERDSVLEYLSFAKFDADLMQIIEG